MRTLTTTEIAVLQSALVNLRSKAAADSAFYAMLHDTIEGIDMQMSEVSGICTELQQAFNNAEQVTIGGTTALV